MELEKILIYTSDRELISSIYKEHKASQKQTNKKRRQQTKKTSVTNMNREFSKEEMQMAKTS